MERIMFEERQEKGAEVSHRDRHLGKENSRQRESRWKDPEVGSCLVRDRERSRERKFF